MCANITEPLWGTPPGTDSTFYKVTRDDYGTGSARMLGTAAEILMMVTGWVILSFLLERFVPFFRDVASPHHWLEQTTITGAIWAVLMVLSPISRRNEEFEFEIRPNRIVKYGRRNTGVIYYDEPSVFREVRRFGRVRGFAVISKRQRWNPSYLFLPARHPDYTDLKQKLEIWHSAPR